MEQLMAAMIEYDKGDAMRIHHFLKVYELARTIGRLEGLDYQILVEADFLVNLYENSADAHAQQAAYQNIFRTETGKRMCRLIYPEAAENA